MDELFLDYINDDEGEHEFMNSSSSDDDSDIDYAINLENENRKKARNTIKNYEEIVAEYSDKEFLSHFRMSRQKVEEVENKFANSEIYLNLVKKGNERTCITPLKHILVFLWFAGHQTASFRDVADRFDLCLSSLHDVITRVLQFLNELAGDIIKLPNEEEKRNTIEFYNNKNHFPNVIGSIDGSHIKIDKPCERSIDYFNRKEYYSIVLQAVCDQNLNFTDVFIGYPGSCHDARVFRNSSLFRELETICAGCYILGDSAYPLLPQLLTPYRDNGHLTAAQKHFNKVHSAVRVAIEHAFGLLKQRFRQLYHLKLRGHERICQFIRSCCVLHNIASKDDEIIFRDEEIPEDDQPQEHGQVGNNVNDGAAIRDQICNQIYLDRR